VDRETIHSALLAELAGILKTPEAKEMALTQCDAFRNEYSTFQSHKGFFRYSGDIDSYRKDEHKNFAVELYLQLKFGLYEYDDGIAYFWKNFIQRDKEVTLYCLLKYLTEFKLDELWIREYENACAKGIKPRDYLKKAYVEKVSAAKKG